MDATMDSVDTKNKNLEEEESCNGETMQDLKDSVFRRVREVSQLIAKARLQAREADIRARYAAEYAERAVSEAQLAHQVASTLAKTGRVVASMALEMANNISMENSGDGDFLSFSFPESSFSMQSGSENSSWEESFASPPAPAEMHLLTVKRSPPKDSPVPAAAKKHEISYPEDLSPQESLSDLMAGSKSLPIVWEDSYSNGWESTPEPWTQKKNTLKMLRKLHSRKVNKQKPSDSDTDSESDSDFPQAYLDCTKQMTEHEFAEKKVEDGLNSDGKTDDQKNENVELMETLNNKLENKLEGVVIGENEAAFDNSNDVDTYSIKGFGLDG